MPHQKAAWHQKWIKKAKEDKITRQTNNWTIVFDMETKGEAHLQNGSNDLVMWQGVIISSFQMAVTASRSSNTWNGIPHYYQYKSGNILSQHV